MSWVWVGDLAVGQCTQKNIESLFRQPLSEHFSPILQADSFQNIFTTNNSLVKILISYQFGCSKGILEYTNFTRTKNLKNGHEKRNNQFKNVEMYGGWWWCGRKDMFIAYIHNKHVSIELYANRLVCMDWAAQSGLHLGPTGLYCSDWAIFGTGGLMVTDWSMIF